MTIQEALDNFIFIKQIQGLSDKSISCYQDFIKPYIAQIGPDFDISELTKDITNNYLHGLIKRDISRSTIATYIRNLKIFLKWLEEEYDLDISANKIKVPKSPKKMLHIYSDNEIRQIFDTVEADEEWIVARNCCIIALMLDSGLRQNEVCTLKRKDIYEHSSTLKVWGKGNKERIVPFGNISRHYVSLYNKLCPYECETLFVNRRGEPLTTNSVKLFMQKISKKLPFPFSSHKLRHNFATNYCLNQYERYGRIDIYSLMLLMGHEDVETTRKYLHFAQQIIATQSSISHLDKVLIPQ